jgi:hypothetical protein
MEGEGEEGGGTRKEEGGRWRWDGDRIEDGTREVGRGMR